MVRKILGAIALSALLTACASDQPRIIQPDANAPVLHLTGGNATQIELPDDSGVQSVVTGNPSLVTAERAGNVVNLIPKEGADGETNLIVRSVNDSHETKVYQYKLIVGE